MIKSQLNSIAEVERILRDNKYVPIENPQKKKIERKVETAKETVNRKIKNNIGIMVLNDGTYRFLNQLNISYQIHNMHNVSFIKSYHTFKLIPVYYKHRDARTSELFKRARLYIKCLTREVTPFQISFIKKQQQYFYEQELYREDIGRYLTYLTCKICYLLLMQEFWRVVSGVFVWAVDVESTGVYVANVHQMKYVKEGNPNQMLEKYMNKKKEMIERKLRSVGKGRREREMQLKGDTVQKQDSRVMGFQRFLKQSFRITMNQLAPQLPTFQRQPIDIDQAFHKLNPKVNFNLSDIVKDNTRFDNEMKKIFFKRPKKKRVISNDISTTRAKDVMKTQKDKSMQTLNTILTSRTARRNRSMIKVDTTGGFTERVDSFRIGSKKGRIRTEGSLEKLKF